MLRPTSEKEALLSSSQKHQAAPCGLSKSQLKSVAQNELGFSTSAAVIKGLKRISISSRWEHPTTRSNIGRVEDEAVQVYSEKGMEVECSSLLSGPSQAGDEDEDVKNDLKDLYEDIIKEITGRHPELSKVVGHYFSTQGKGIRPLMAIQMARAINAELHENKSFILHSQKQMAIACEMFHAVSLLHDDVIDMSDTRRGQPSVNAVYGQKKAVLGGDYILAKGTSIVARLKNHEVILMLAQILENLVHGEFMQMGADEDETDRFTHYIRKSFNKTASLMAYGCKGVAVLAGADNALTEAAFQYGKNIGIAFQIIDDLLDFISSSATMGKPAAVDLKLGLATAPVLFAAEKHPELNDLIERRFSQPGDVEKALDFVHNSDGLHRTKLLAQKYCTEAVRSLDVLRDSPYKKSLIELTHKVLHRSK